MEVSKERVTGGTAVGDRVSRSKWQMNTNGKVEKEFEEFFRAFASSVFNGQGAFKVDGSLVFEFVPKMHMRSEKLISPETSFYFHRMAEGVVYNDNNEARQPGDTKKRNPAFEGYNYQKSVPPLMVETLDGFVSGA